MKGFNEKIMEEFVKQDKFLSHIKKESPGVFYKTLYNDFIYGDSVMEKQYLEFSKKIIKGEKIK